MTKQVEIVVTTATKVEEGKKYILQIDRRSINMEDAHKILEALHKWGAEGILVMYNDKPLKLIEVEDA